MNRTKFMSVTGFFTLIAFSGFYWTNSHNHSCGIHFDLAEKAKSNELKLSKVLQLKYNKGLTTAEMCEWTDGQLKNEVSLVKSKSPNQPDKAAEHRFRQMADSKTGLIDKNKMRDAILQVQTMKRELKKELERNPQKDGGINSEQWAWMGPGNIGGRIRTLVFDPTNADRMLAGSISGGIWETENAGVSWAPVDDFMANLAVSSIVVNPANFDEYYAGTGEGVYNYHGIPGVGIFKSSDNGETWSLLSSTSSGSNFDYVNRLAFSPSGSTLLAATATGIWRSTDNGDNWTREDTARTNDLDFHPGDNDKAIAGGWGSAKYTLDGGDTWLTATGITSGRIEVAYARTNADIVFASVDSNSGELWKSTDGGQTYSVVNTGTNFLSSQGWYDNALWVDPTDEDTIIVGGVDLYRTTDGGTTLDRVSFWYNAPSSPHADQHFIIEHPNFNGTTNKQVYFTNDGGVYTAEDVYTAINMVGWQELNNNLGITQFYSVAVAPDGTLIGGTQDNGTIVYKGDTEGWNTTAGGDGTYAAADPDDSNYLYGAYQYLSMHRSTNGGVFSSDIGSTDIDGDSPNFIAPFILDPNDSTRLLAGARQLWASDDAKGSTVNWTSIKDAILSNEAITAIAVEPGNSDVIYVGHGDGSLYKTTNGTDATPTWIEIGVASLPGRDLLRIAISPTDTDTLYVSFSQYAANVYKSTDGGTTWNLATGNGGSNALVSAPTRALAIHPNDKNTVYAGTEVGLFVTEDGGENWGLQNDGPANVSVDELIWQDDTTLIAATYGRGVFKAVLNFDTTPDSFTFASQTDVELTSTVTSETKTIEGISTGVDISVSNGEYSVGCSTFTSSPGTILNGETVCVRHTSADTSQTNTVTQLTIGTATESFTSTTGADRTPDVVSFTTQTGVSLSSEITSNTVTVSGIEAAIDISVSNGEYSIGCSTSGFTSTAGTIDNGETVCVRHTSSSAGLTNTLTVLTLHQSNVTFTTTTKEKKKSSGGSLSTSLLIMMLFSMALIRQRRREKVEHS